MYDVCNVYDVYIKISEIKRIAVGFNDGLMLLFFDHIKIVTHVDIQWFVSQHHAKPR